MTRINRHLRPKSQATESGIGFVESKMTRYGSVMYIMKKKKAKVRGLWYAKQCVAMSFNIQKAIMQGI
jgi:hypothetical protein